MTSSSSDTHIAVVTGATGEIGRAIVNELLARGSTVLAHSTSTDKAEQLVAEMLDTHGPSTPIVGLVADLAKPADIADMFDSITELFGRLDTLVNNAGISGPYGTFDQASADDLQQVFAVNSIAPMLCAQRAVPLMAAGGAIINISTKAAVFGSANEWVHYAASKGALETFTTGIAHELAPRNIRVNAVRPGLMTNNFGSAPDGRIDNMAPNIPMQRAGRPDEIASVVAWLAFDAPDYVTGSFIDATGGR